MHKIYRFFAILAVVHSALAVTEPEPKIEEIINQIFGVGTGNGDSCNHNGVSGQCSRLRDCAPALNSPSTRRNLKRCGYDGPEPLICCVDRSLRSPVATPASVHSGGGCVLPGYPPHSTYTVYNKPEAVPGQVYDLAILIFTCDPGYGVVGSNTTYCFGGNLWQQPMPQCTRFCRLTPDPSVNYYCKITGDGVVVSGTRVCHELEPHGTEVVPECNRPVYYSSNVLLNMHCVDGTWDHIAVCQPDCGTPTPIANRLIINGKRTKHGELPWHAGVYDKTFTLYKQICGGSLISTRVIISAAHCFWKAGRQEAASTYAVALGKIYRPWDEAMDTGPHKSDVSEIKTPVRYLGEAGHYQEDIALVFMSTPVVYRTYIRPVCIDFGEEFDRNQLQNTNSGKVSGWGLTAADGSSSPLLLTTELPYVDAAKCIIELPSEFKPYLTSDKFCAGNLDGTTVCLGDSGGGLAFPSVERGIRRYYLRGVVSTAPHSDHKCNVNSYTTFTHIQSHATFIRDHGLGVVSGPADIPPTSSTARTTPKVNHEIEQGAQSPRVDSTRRLGQCDAPVLSCCNPSDSRQQQQKCFARLGCGEYFEQQDACSAEHVQEVLDVISAAYTTPKN